MTYTKATMSDEKDECDKLTTPHDYYLWRTGVYNNAGRRNGKQNGKRKAPDSYWFCPSSNGKEVYLLHVWEREVWKLPHIMSNGSKKTYDVKGRIECDCKSFIYSKLTPRCCKHSVQLAKEIFGNRTHAYKTVFNAKRLDEPDEWCSHLFTVEEEIRLKIRDENRARLKAQRQLHELPERIKLQKNRKPNTLGVKYH